MKFAQVSLVAILGLNPSARPVVTKTEESNTTSWPGEDTSCNNAQVKRDISTRCVNPGESNQQHITCWWCNWWGGDAHPLCTIPCCDPDSKIYNDNQCGCRHNGKSYKVGYESNSATKCCGVDIHHAPKWSGDNCGCADVGATPKMGAKETDCCSGTWAAGPGTPCVKAKPGTKNLGMRAQDCVTGKLANDGSCAEGKPGEAVIDPSHCASGKAQNGVCLCVAAGDKHKDAAACCSGAHKDGTDVCSCMPSTYNLHHGATAKDCCSEKAHGGVCQCARGGAPIQKGHGVHGCCAKHAVEHGSVSHCGCKTPKDNVTAQERGECCGGFYDGVKGECACIPNGFLVAGFVTKESCCGGVLVNDKDGGFVCGKIGDHPKVVMEHSGLHEPVQPLYYLEHEMRPVGR